MFLSRELRQHRNRFSHRPAFSDPFRPPCVHRHENQSQVGPDGAINNEGHRDNSSSNNNSSSNKVFAAASSRGGGGSSQRNKRAKVPDHPHKKTAKMFGRVVGKLNGRDSIERARQDITPAMRKHTWEYWREINPNKPNQGMIADRIRDQATGRSAENPLLVADLAAERGDLIGAVKALDIPVVMAGSDLFSYTMADGTVIGEVDATDNRSRFADKSVDVAVLSHALMSPYQARHQLRDAVRVCRDGGRIIIAMMWQHMRNAAEALNDLFVNGTLRKFGLEYYSITGKDATPAQGNNALLVLQKCGPPDHSPTPPHEIEPGDGKQPEGLPLAGALREALEKALPTLHAQDEQARLKDEARAEDANGQRKDGTHGRGGPAEKKPARRESFEVAELKRVLGSSELMLRLSAETAEEAAAPNILYEYFASKAVSGDALGKYARGLAGGASREQLVELLRALLDAGGAHLTSTRQGGYGMLIEAPTRSVVVPRTLWPVLAGMNFGASSTVRGVCSTSGSYEKEWTNRDGFREKVAGAEGTVVRKGAIWLDDITSKWSGFRLSMMLVEGPEAYMMAITKAAWPELLHNRMYGSFSLNSRRANGSHSGFSGGEVLFPGVAGVGILFAPGGSHACLTRD